MLIPVVIVGALAISSSVIFIKLSSVHPILLAAYRQLLAALILLPFFLRDLRRAPEAKPLNLLARSAIPGVILGLHFITWIGGVRMTLAANATLIISMVPLVMPFLVYAVASERITAREITGSLIALLGVLVLAYSDLRFTRETILGDLVCLLSMLLYAVYLVLAKRSRDQGSLFLYIVPLYAVGGLFCLGLSTFWVRPSPYPPIELLWIFGLALIPTVVGHSTFNYCMRRMRAQVVSVIGMGEFIFSTAMAFLFLGELPALLFYPAAGLVTVGALVVLLGSRE